MNMMLLTGLSVALALSVMSSNNFYANKSTTASIKQFDEQSKQSKEARDAIAKAEGKMKDAIDTAKSDAENAVNAVKGAI